MNYGVHCQITKVKDGTGFIIQFIDQENEREIGHFYVTDVKLNKMKPTIKGELALWLS